jgi:hypothetical protein
MEPKSISRKRESSLVLKTIREFEDTKISDPELVRMVVSDESPVKRLSPS